VAPESVKTTDIYRGAIPFIGVQVFALGLVAVFPGMVHAFLKVESASPVAEDRAGQRPESPVARLQIEVPGWADGAEIPERFVQCQAGLEPETSTAGDNVSPELRWDVPPEGTRALLLTLIDLEGPEWVEDINQPGVRISDTAPRVETLVWSQVLPADARGVEEGAASDYQGPCPPWNDVLEHSYVYRVQALDTGALELTAELEALDEATRGHVLAEGSWIGSVR
jgi:hypothetical protein